MKYVSTNTATRSVVPGLLQVMTFAVAVSVLSLAFAVTSSAEASRAGSADAPTGGSAPPARGELILAAPTPTFKGGKVTFTGSVAGGGPGTRLVIELLSDTGLWGIVAFAITNQDGSFSTSWKTTKLGKYNVRVRRVGQAGAISPETPSVSELSIYRGQRASWYGPGFYGKTTACGQKFSRQIVGVAHRKLPCGTPVEIYYRGKRTVAPVVDRGPFANKAHWDLSYAVAKQLGFIDVGVDKIGVLPQPQPAP